LVLTTYAKRSDEEVKSRFDQAREIVDDLLRRVRVLSFDLRPAALDQFGLLPALLALFERYTDQTGVRVDFKHLGMERRFAPELENNAYRIVQEALTNVARHAGAASVSVRVWATEDLLNVQVEDRGRGFDLGVALATPGASGLTGLRERVGLLGAELTIETRPGVGTQVTAELPLSGTERER
jgi:signal transduction histidine kinase